MEFGKDYKDKRRVIVKNDETGRDRISDPEGQARLGAGRRLRRAGRSAGRGPRVPHDILKVMGVEALSDYLVNEIQDVYRLQGVKINDKHIEVIVRQMLQKVEIMDPGDTTFLAGEQVDRTEFDAENASWAGTSAGAWRCRCCKASPRRSLQTNSFISAASFQETTRVLTEAATAGQDGYADRPEGERDRRAADPGGHRVGDEPAARDCGGPRSADAEDGHGSRKSPRGEGRGVGASSPTDHQKAGALNALRPFSLRPHRTAGAFTFSYKKPEWINGGRDGVPIIWHVCGERRR